MENSLKSIYEKAGLFYLGKDIDPSTMDITPNLTLLKSKNFTTHAMIVGMTGSGKTGLGISIIEEALIDNIPAIVIDPKGDMGDLCLSDPEFKAENFLPWVKDEALSKGIDPMEYAQKVADEWKKGLESWGEDSERVRRFHNITKTIYTPGSSAGVPVNIAGVLKRPPDEIINNSDDFVSYLKSSVMALLALVGISAEPLNSKEYIFLAQILSKSWLGDENLSIETLVSKILNPPFTKIGVMPLESFYSEKERFKLATKMNSLLASPGFSNWLSGEPMDIDKFLYDENGKAKISIFSIAHLNDSERMFFVTLLLNNFVAYMRRQSGSSRLKTILYMDEIFGFFPPIKTPPSKEPMLVLLKQARAFGVGVILSTQNPADIDYKGLANIGTWFVGRLQTKQDINRVIDGLSGSLGSSMNKSEISQILSALKKRVFFLKSAHLDSLRLFETRWVMSYLKGPLKRDDISLLMHKDRVQNFKTPALESEKDGDYDSLPLLDSTIPQKFEIDSSGLKKYRPFLATKIDIKYHDMRRGIEADNRDILWMDLNECDSWECSESDNEDFSRYPDNAPNSAKGLPLPSWVSSDKGLKKAKRDLKDYIYREKRLELYRCKKLKMESKPDESEADFRRRVQEKLDDLKDEAIEKLKDRYEAKEERLLDRLKRAQAQVEKEKSDQVSSLIGVGVSILGALFGRSSSSKIGTAINRSGRVLREHNDVSRAQERVADIQEKIQELEDELEDKISEIDEKYSLDNYEIESFSIRPKKSDIDIEDIAIVWRVDF